MKKNQSLGRLFTNRRKRKDSRDPDMLGFIDFPQGKASLGGWIKRDTQEIELSLKAWARKSRIYSYGTLKLNDVSNHQTAPLMIGEANFGSATYSVAAWLNQDKYGRNFMKLTARLIDYKPRESPLSKLCNDQAE